MRNIGLFVLLVLLIGSTSLDLAAADFSYERLDPESDLPGRDSLIVRGEIRKGDYARLLSFIKRDTPKFRDSTMWVLASPGGDLLEAMKIGEFVKATYRTVFVNDEIGVCASACFFIYVSAVERDAVSPSLGIHRPYFSSETFSRLTLADAESKQRRLLKEARRFLEDRDVPQYLIERMFSLSSDEVYWLTIEDIDRLGLRLNWFDQVLVDRCGLNKMLEMGFMKEGESWSLADQAIEHIGTVANCAYEITKSEADVNLKSKLSEIGI